jgi:hypothetical protein
MDETDEKQIRKTVRQNNAGQNHSSFCIFILPSLFCPEWAGESCASYGVKFPYADYA